MSAADDSATGGVELAISGMTCSTCINAVTRALSRVVGVNTVQVALETGQARVRGTAGPEILVAAVEKAGFEARVAQVEG